MEQKWKNLLKKKGSCTKGVSGAFDLFTCDQGVRAPGSYTSQTEMVLTGSCIAFLFVAGLFMNSAFLVNEVHV